MSGLLRHHSLWMVLWFTPALLAEIHHDAQSIVELLNTVTIEAAVEGVDGLQSLKIGIEEEWPAVMGDPLFLLEATRSRQLIEALQAFRRFSATELKIEHRVVVQQELWAAFDQLYLLGALPDRSDRVDERLRQRLLFELAQTIKAMAPAYQELSAVQDTSSTLPASTSPSEWIELCSLEDLTIHDYASQMRRVTRLLYDEPSLNYLELNDAAIQAMLIGGRKLGAGSRAVILEQALVVMADGQIMATSVAPIIRSIEIGTDSSTPKPVFSIRKMDLQAEDYRYASMRPFKADAGGWAYLDLPNIPSKPGVGVRVSLRQSCAGCHEGGRTAGFTPRPRSRYRRDIRLARYGDPMDHRFVAERVIRSKLAGMEYKALIQYLRMSEQDLLRLTGQAPARAVVGDAPIRLWVVLAYVCLAIWIGLYGISWLARNRNGVVHDAA